MHKKYKWGALAWEEEVHWSPAWLTAPWKCLHKPVSGRPESHKWNDRWHHFHTVTAATDTVPTRAVKEPVTHEPAAIRTQIFLFMMTGYLRGLQMATYRSYAITDRSTHSVEPMAREKYIWAAHPENEMVFFPEIKFASIGVRAEEVYQMSRHDRLLRKKYMGVCRSESRTLTEIRIILPSKVINYISKHSTNMVISTLG